MSSQTFFEFNEDLDEAPTDAYLLYWLWQAAAASVAAAIIKETESASGPNPVTEEWPSWDTYLQLWA
jgi:hypothetical protein